MMRRHGWWVLVLVMVVGPGRANSASSQPVFLEELVKAALGRTDSLVVYDGRYRTLAYPGGDVPAGEGVCTDVVVRAYRAVGVDLQVLVHEDMRRFFDAYPKRWGLRRPDSNIDHRRVPNLRRFFERHGEVLKRSQVPEDYNPGDLVTWNVAREKGELPHIGVVVNRLAPGGKRWMVVHNIGAGPKLEDCLFLFPITGHYRFIPKALR